MSGRLADGFSLLELMIALLIVGLMVSLATLGFDSGRDSVKLDSELRQLVGVAEFAVEEAELNGIDYGLRIEPFTEQGEYRYRLRWMQRGRNGWVSLMAKNSVNSEVFATQELPPNLELALELEGVASVGLLRSRDREASDIPQIIFYASGETSPGSIGFTEPVSGDLIARVEWDLLGQFTLTYAGEP